MKSLLCNTHAASLSLSLSLPFSLPVSLLPLLLLPLENTRSVGKKGMRSERGHKKQRNN